MAFFSNLPFAALFLTSSLLLQIAQAEIICENLSKQDCAFAIGSSGKRCLLETYASRGGFIEYQCKTSNVVAKKFAGYIETDECVKACGVDRKMIGISSDSLMVSQFMSKLCSADCYQNCFNIADLYFNLAAGEGVFLPELCDKQRSNPHRAMIQLMSSGEETASSPASSEVHNIIHYTDHDETAPAPEPYWF